VLGIILLAALLFLLFIFVIPGFKPFGMTGVWERSSYTTYIGDEIDEIMRDRNIIIESQNTEIRIRARNIGQGQGMSPGQGQQHDKARITVYENANGISINSYDRTQLNFMHYIHDDGEAYTKIIVQEPKGAMSRTAWVEINLVRSVETPDAIQDPYNFILNTGRSNVKFEHDPAVEEVKIDYLVVNGTGHVSLPTPKDNDDHTWIIEKDLEINSPDALVTCKPFIKGQVKINGNSRNVTLGRVGGGLSAYGKVNNVYVDRVEGTLYMAGDKEDKPSDFVNLSVYNECIGEVFIRSQDASINVQKANKVDIETNRGSVNISGIDGVMNNYNLKVEKLYPMLTNSYYINEQTLNVDARVIMESGSLTLGDVYGHVYINKKYGGASVTYANSEFAIGNCFIRAIDGTINVYRIRGAANIFVTSASANSRVNVSYAAVARRVSDSPGNMNFPANNDIVVDGQKDPKRGDGDITITLIGKIGITIELYNTWDAWCYITNVRIQNFSEYGVHHNVNDINAPIVKVKTSARFDLRE